MLRAKTHFVPKDMETLGIEPGASRMLSGCDTTAPCVLLLLSFGSFRGGTGPAGALPCSLPPWLPRRRPREFLVLLLGACSLCAALASGAALRVASSCVGSRREPSHGAFAPKVAWLPLPWEHAPHGLQLDPAPRLTQPPVFAREHRDHGLTAPTRPPRDRQHVLRNT